ncbi:sensor histidine kinase [Azohydromonas sediminis]|uniref:sensor histidine kinase n=1 Tax=Azohydromonas sediminis TaxID=2259674 RepID=UPI000E650A5A|nr:ATP-binding protein [Azohydromonas sediminis]
MAARLHPPAAAPEAVAPTAADAPPRRFSRWDGWRLRLLALIALALALALLLLARALGDDAWVAADWRAGDGGALVLHAAADPALAARAGQAVVGIVGRDGRVVAVDALLLQHDVRWVPDGATRQRLLEQHRRWRDAVATATVTLQFADGAAIATTVTARGAAGLGLAFWSLGLLAVLLALAGAAAALRRPLARGVALRLAPYVVLAGAQALHLAGLAVASVPGPATALGLGATLGAWHTALDLLTAAAAVHAAAVHPHPHRHAGVIVAGAWLVAGVLSALAAAGALPGAWAWTQVAMLALGAAAVALLGSGAAHTPHPLAPVLQRFTVLAVASFALLSAVSLAVPPAGAAAATLVSVAVPAWHAFVALLLLALPRLPAMHPAWREAALVAVTTTVAVALHGLCAGALGLSNAAALGTAVMLSVGALAIVRPWVNAPLAGLRAPDAERLLDHLLSATHDTQHDPRHGAGALRALLAEVFEPREIAPARHAPRRARVFGAGSTLVVPLPAHDGDAAAPGALVLRYARQGRRLFTREDARLADRAVEQLRRATRFGDAVEQGRTEERSRLAQDLHDDIGARLLTLMYQAPTPQMEDYLRHTLQDLKTLTRGLAATSRRLGEAAAEWKSDLGQRLEMAHCRLAWSVSYDCEPELGVAQWSALTRLLRELVTNVIAHAHASRVEIELSVERGRLTLLVSDDGDGGDPAAWSPGLGLASVRKRVRQLGGQVQWRQLAPSGICCRIDVPLQTLQPPG